MKKGSLEEQFGIAMFVKDMIHKFEIFTVKISPEIIHNYEEVWDGSGPHPEKIIKNVFGQISKIMLYILEHKRLNYIETIIVIQKTTFGGILRNFIDLPKKGGFDNDINKNIFEESLKKKLDDYIKDVKKDLQLEMLSENPDLNWLKDNLMGCLFILKLLR